MTHVEQFLYLEKFASPKWVKMLSKLSPASRSLLASKFPTGMSRTVGPELARGVEGRVYPSFTGGGVGDTVTKVFNNRPAFVGDIPTPMVGKITGGGKGVKEVMGNMTIPDRVQLMRNYPTIFPKIHSQNARGYTMEKLLPVAEGVGSPMARMNVKDKITNMRHLEDFVNRYTRMRDANTPKALSFFDKLRRKPAEAPSKAFLDYSQKVKLYQDQLDAGRKQFPSMWKQRNEGFASPAHPVSRLAKELKGLSSSSAGTTPITHGTRSSSPFLDMGTDKIRISDFGLSSGSGPQSPVAWHNIMQRPDGKALISDPVPAKVKNSLSTIFNNFNPSYSKPAPTTSNLAITVPS